MSHIFDQSFTIGTGTRPDSTRLLRFTQNPCGPGRCPKSAYLTQSPTLRVLDLGGSELKPCLTLKHFHIWNQTDQPTPVAAFIQRQWDRKEVQTELRTWLPNHNKPTFNKVKDKTPREHRSSAMTRLQWRGRGWSYRVIDTCCTNITHQGRTHNKPDKESCRGRPTFGEQAHRVNKGRVKAVLLRHQFR